MKHNHDNLDSEDNNLMCCQEIVYLFKHNLFHKWIALGYKYGLKVVSRDHLVDLCYKPLLCIHDIFFIMLTKVLKFEYLHFTLKFTDIYQDQETKHDTCKNGKVFST